MITFKEILSKKQEEVFNILKNRRKSKFDQTTRVGSDEFDKRTIQKLIALNYIEIVDTIQHGSESFSTNFGKDVYKKMPNFVWKIKILK